MKKNLFNYISLVIIVTIFFSYREAFTYTPIGTKLKKQVVTSYWPGAGGGVEGGWETSKAQPGATGHWKKTHVPSTLEMVRKGESNYVTIASDPSRYGEWYTIPKITYTNTKGETYTMYNVKAYVHDTGGAFQGRPDKFDIAVDRGTGFSSGDGLDKQLIQNAGSLEKQGIVFERDDGKGETKTTWESGKDTGGTGKTVEPIEQCESKPTEAEKQECEQKQKPPPKPPEPPPKPPPKPQPPKPPTQVSSGGELWDSRDRYCHKHQGPPGPKGLKMAQTCNAGFKCFNYSCGDDICHSSYYVNDCGPNNINCDSAAQIGGGGYCPPKESNPQDGPLAGCLNYKCKTKNAIWDMGSKKCGCDDGSMSGSSGATPSGPGTTKPTQPTKPKQPTTPTKPQQPQSTDDNGTEQTTPDEPTGDAPPQGSGSKKISDATDRALGQQVCQTGLTHACANTVSSIMEDSGIPFKKTNATAQMYKNLNSDPNWVKIPINQAKKGDLIISPTSGNTIGHVGIVLNDGAKNIGSSSRGGAFESNYTRRSWDTVFNERKSLPTYIFRYKGN